MAVLKCAPAASEPEDPPAQAAPISYQPGERRALQPTRLQRGCAIAAMGSPFGALSLQHFGSHVAAGIIANTIPGQVWALCCHACLDSRAAADIWIMTPHLKLVRSAQDGSEAALYLADMRCIPGMEGGPVVDADGTLVGIMAVPLSSHAFHAEVLAPCFSSMHGCCTGNFVQLCDITWTRGFCSGMSRVSHIYHVSQVPVVIPAGSLRGAFAAWRARAGAQAPAAPAASALPLGRGAAAQQGAFARQLQRNAHRAAPWSAAAPQLQPVAASAQNLRLQPRRSHTVCPYDSAVAQPWEQHGALLAQRSSEPSGVILQGCHAAARAATQSARHADAAAALPSLHMPDMRQAVAAASGSIVALLTEHGMWASGVLASARQGFIVTNAHLIAERPPRGQHAQAPDDESVSSSRQGAGQRLQMQLWRQRMEGTGPTCARAELQQPGVPEWHSARVVYVFQGPLDLAVLQLEDRGALAGVQPLRLREAHGQRVASRAGEAVAVVGYPLVSPRRCFGPWATAGIVTKVMRRLLLLRHGTQV